jgi:CRP-like cAMP-binding protein
MQTTNKLSAFIQSIFPMSSIKAEDIVSRFSEKDLSKNELLLTEGKICTFYGFVENGFLRAYTHDVDGNDITTGFYEENQVICELFSFFKKVPSRENIQAITDCRLLYISFDELQDVFHNMPEFREFGRTILVNAYAQLKQRMLAMIQETGEQRYAHLLQTNPDIFQHVPLKNIATYLGITDTSLSRIRKEFAKKPL